MKDSYTWRSKVVHGLRLSKLTPEKSRTLLVELEVLIRRALEKLLLDRDLRQTFDTKAREAYLDELVFK